MEKLMERFQDFNKSSIANLLMKLQKSIEKFNKTKSNFIFTHQYQVDMGITVAGYAYKNTLWQN